MKFPAKFFKIRDLLCHLNCVPFMASECISQFHEFFFKWVASSLSRRNQQTPRSTHLRANACKYRATGGQSQNLKFLHTLPIDKYQQVAKRDVLCFSKDRLNLEKIENFNFPCWRLQNNQNLRRNEPFSKFRPCAKGR